MKTRILQANLPGNMDEAARVIRSGGLVAFPTETVYGLGADALNETAVAGIFRAKDRPYFDPLIVHCAELGEAERLVKEFPDRARSLARRFWPGPLTLVLSRSHRISDIVSAGLSTVAVRVPAHPVSQGLIKQAGCPIAAPSANLFGHISPTRADDVLADLEGRIDLILDDGPTPIGVESTVVLVEGDRVFLLRPGGVSLEELEETVGPVMKWNKKGDMLSPGSLQQHYAPRVPLYLFEGDPACLESVTLEKEVFIALSPPFFSSCETIYLSRSGCLIEAAANLYRVLHDLEKRDIPRVIVVPGEERGLGRAIMDRLRRASTGKVFIDREKLFYIDKRAQEGV